MFAEKGRLGMLLDQSLVDGDGLLAMVAGLGRPAEAAERKVEIRLATRRLAAKTRDHRVVVDQLSTKPQRLPTFGLRLGVLTPGMWRTQVLKILDVQQQVVRFL